MLLDLVLFELLLLLFLLSLGVSLRPFQSFEFLLDLLLLIFGRLSRICFLHKRSHALLRERLQLFYAAWRGEIGEFCQDSIGGIPGWTKIALPFFFNDDLLENALDGLLAALRVLVVEVVDDLLLGLKARVAGADKLGPEAQDGVGVALAEIINLLRFLDTER